MLLWGHFEALLHFFGQFEAGKLGIGCDGMNLVESMREAKLEELEAKILKCEQDVQELWREHLKIAEQAGRKLQELNQLRCEIAKLKERKKEADSFVG